MKKHANLIRSLAALVLSSAIITGCSSLGNKPNAANAPSFDVQKLEPAKISFCFYSYQDGGRPGNLNQINEMLTELNKKASKEINTEISIQWLPNSDYESELEKLLKSDNRPDAFLTWNPESLVSEGLVKDITELFPQMAPNYYSQLVESRKDEFEFSKIDKKLYTISNNWLSFPHDYIIARQDLVKKYAPAGLSTFEQYGEFLQKVKLYEKDITPGLVEPYMFFDAYMMGNGYFSMDSMFYKWDSKDLTPTVIENTQEYNDAYNLYKQGMEKGLLINYTDPSFEAIIHAGRLASVLQSGNQLHIAYSSLPRGFNYCTYTLYPDKLYQTKLPSESIAISANSSNTERVLIFVEWLQSNQENYDLFMYGIKDKQYSLKGNIVDMYGNGNDVIIGWDGSDALRNYLYERPYFFEPDNYKEFLEKNCIDNTESYIKTFERYGYDFYKYLNMNKEDRAILEKEQKTMGDYYSKRYKNYGEYMERMRAGDFSKTLSEYMSEAGGKESTDKLVESYTAYMNKFKK